MNTHPFGRRLLDPRRGVSNLFSLRVRLIAGCLTILVLLPFSATRAGDDNACPVGTAEIVKTGCMIVGFDTESKEKEDRVTVCRDSTCGPIAIYELDECGSRRCFGRLDRLLVHASSEGALQSLFGGLNGALRTKDLAVEALPLANTFLVTLPRQLTGQPDEDLEGLVRFLAANRPGRAGEATRESWVEPDYLVHFTGSGGDGLAGDPVRCISRESDLRRLGVQQAHQQFMGSSNTVVAVIDSGVDTSHPAFAPNIWLNGKELDGSPDVDDDGNGYVDDDHGWDFTSDSITNGVHLHGETLHDELGHGTLCAGIIGTTADKAPLLEGVSPNVSLMPLKVLENNGACISTSNLIEAIAYAGLNGADVVSASWGGICPSAALREAIRCLGCPGSDALFVTASANVERSLDACPEFPASYKLPNLLVVGASFAENHQDYFYPSGYGSQVHLSAPGCAVCSAFPSDGYCEASGTSMATAFVAGTAALVKGYDPRLTALEIRNRILGSVDIPPKPNPLEGKSCTGGRLNVYRALVGDTEPIPNSCNQWNPRDVCRESARACFAGGASSDGPAGATVAPQLRLRP